MKTQKERQISYGFTRTVNADFDKVLDRAREGLKNEGFGVLSEISLDEKLKEKLGVDFRRYVILGACNPALAYKMLQEEIGIGLLLPCNVIVYEADEPGKSVVAAVDALAMLSVVGESPVATDVAKEVNERLQRAIAQI